MSSNMNSSTDQNDKPTLLSDGTTGHVVHLSSPVVFSGAASLNGKLWLLARGLPYMHLRDSRTGALASKVDLLEEGVAIAAVGARVWVSTIRNKIYVFDSQATLIGTMQPSGLPLVRRFFGLGPDWLLTAGAGKDVTQWDTTNFSVLRTYFGRIAGEEVLAVCAADDHQQGGVVIATTHAVRLYSQDGTILSESLQGACALCRIVVPDYTLGGGGSASSGSGAPGGSNINRGSGATGGGGGGSFQPKAFVWAAHPSFVSVFTVDPPSTFSGVSGAPRRVDRDRKTISVAGVREIFESSIGRVGTLDGEGLISIWCAKDLAPLRSFRAAAILGASSCSLGFTVCAADVVQRTHWTVGNELALTWTEEQPVSDGAALEQRQIALDLQRDEIAFLRKKLYYVENIGQLFRQKVSGIVRGGGKTSSSSAMRSYSEVDEIYQKALEAWRTEYDVREPLPVVGPQIGDVANAVAAQQGKASIDSTSTIADPSSSNKVDSANFTEYWKTKYYQAQHDLECLKQEQESVLAIMQADQPQPHQSQGQNQDGEGGEYQSAGAGSTMSSKSASDLARAQHICQILKEKNELRERERQLADDVLRLRHKLRELNSPLGTNQNYEDVAAMKEEMGGLRKEVIRLRAEADEREAVLCEANNNAKQVNVLKKRLREAREELDRARLEQSEHTIQSQGDLTSALESVAAMQRALEEAKIVVGALERERDNAVLAATEKQALAEKLAAQHDTLQREARQRTEVEQAAQASVREEIALLCTTLDERDKVLAETQAHLSSAKSEARRLGNALAIAEAQVQSKDAEIQLGNQRIDHLESIMSDRKTYAKTVAELQGRLELAVEELRRSFTPVQFADSFKNLEERMSQLVALESQLRQKDDVIAMRDDQIELLRQHLTNIQKHVLDVSSLFAQLPRSVEEVEVMMVENDEFRRRLGMDAASQERVQQKLLELRAKRKAGEQISQADIHSIGKAGDKLGKLQKAASDALASVANSIGADDAKVAK